MVLEVWLCIMVEADIRPGMLRWMHADSSWGRERG